MILWDEADMAFSFIHTQRVSGRYFFKYYENTSGTHQRNRCRFQANEE